MSIDLSLVTIKYNVYVHSQQIWACSQYMCMFTINRFEFVYSIYVYVHLFIVYMCMFICSQYTCVCSSVHGIYVYVHYWHIWTCSQYICVCSLSTNLSLFTVYMCMFHCSQYICMFICSQYIYVCSSVHSIYVCSFVHSIYICMFIYSQYICMFICSQYICIFICSQYIYTCSSVHSIYVHVHYEQSWAYSQYKSISLSINFSLVTWNASVHCRDVSLITMPVCLFIVESNKFDWSACVTIQCKKNVLVYCTWPSCHVLQGEFTIGENIWPYCQKHPIRSVVK